MAAARHQRPRAQETAGYIERAEAQRLEGFRLPFAVIDGPSGRVLGSTSYHDIVPAIDRLEIGYTWYAASVQRTHVNTSCKLLLLAHAFDALHARLVGFRTDSFNFASQRAIERLGAKRDGCCGTTCSAATGPCATPSCTASPPASGPR